MAVRQQQDVEPLLTPAEVAALFRVDPKTVTRWANSGKLTSIRTLGELANRKRDVPDPFRMQMGAWLTYARELDDIDTKASH